MARTFHTGNVTPFSPRKTHEFSYRKSAMRVAEELKEYGASNRVKTATSKKWLDMEFPAATKEVWTKIKNEVM